MSDKQLIRETTDWKVGPLEHRSKQYQWEEPVTYFNYAIPPSQVGWESMTQQETMVQKTETIAHLFMGDIEFDCWLVGMFFVFMIGLALYVLGDLVGQHPILFGITFAVLVICGFLSWAIQRVIMGFSIKVERKGA